MKERKGSRMQPDKANGPVDIVVTEMLKELVIETIHEVTKWFRRRFHGECHSASVNICSVGVPAEARRFLYSRLLGHHSHTSDGKVFFVCCCVDAEQHHRIVNVSKYS